MSLDTQDERQFGEALPDLTYVDRPGVYGLVLQDGLLLVIDTPSGYFLPGGGVDDGETPENALRREFREETGLSVTPIGTIGTARQYVVDSQTGLGYNKVERFYRVAITHDLGEPVEADHAVRWLAVAEALTNLREPAQVWAVSVTYPLA